MASIERLELLEYLGLTEADVKGIVNPFERRTSADFREPHMHVLRLMRCPDYFYYTAKILFNIELMPFQCVILKEMWGRRFPMLIGARGMGKSFLLGLYANMRAVLIQGTKVVICGSGFRQAKTVFNYAENIWHHSPVLQSLMAGTRSGPEHGADRWVLRLGDSTITALPIGDGTRIRGERANCIIGDEFASIPQEIFETVISGFGVVNLSPVQKAKKAARRRVLKRLGKMTQDQVDASKQEAQGNQLIISGTAFYQFNHFCTYWKKWKTIIECKGDQIELRKRLGETLEEGLDWRDFVVIRFPYTMIPEDYYDLAQIARSRATIHSGIFQNEFGACTHPDELVITSDGCKPMQEVEVGDLVLTHKGRFRHVTGKTWRYSGGEIVRYRTLACSFESMVTADHPYWVPGDHWESLGGLTEGTNLVNLKELSGLESVDLRPIVRDYLEVDGGIYPRPGNTKLSRDEFTTAREAKGSCVSIAKRLNLSYGSVWQARRDRGARYNSIPPTVDLDYDLGLVVGYYASEGSIGSSGRAVSFALDGHVGTGLEVYIEQLVGALKSVFGITPKTYDKPGNVCDVVVTQSLVADFLKWVCPGVAHTKAVRPEILFSNEDFLKGFITGYWNGDGHIPKEGKCKTQTPKSSSASRNLATQVRTAISYFGVTASLQTKAAGTARFRGKDHWCKQSYIVSLSGANDRRFRKLFFGISMPSSNKCSSIENRDGHSFLPFTKKEVVPYDGPVFNLHVDEDESYSLLNATVHNCFSSDSNGFYPRSLIERCITHKDKPVTPKTEGGSPVWFDAVTRGNSARTYVMGIDPAAQQDNFAIVILEVHEGHRRIVYCWTTNKEKFNAKARGQLIEERDYYGYCARKIRELMKLFTCEVLALDSQGGGQNGVLEALHDPDKMKPGEKAIWPVTPDHPLSDGKERDEDDQPGLHIVELVNFARAEWTSGANHGMRKDFEDQALLFPMRDAVTLGEAFLKDQEDKRLFDTLEDCVDEIDELKDELATISFDQTPGTLRDKWDTPEVKIAGSKKGRLRKDRYSALLMANYAARRLHRLFEAPAYEAHGGFADKITPPKDGDMWSFAPDWFLQQAGDDYSSYGWVTSETV